MIALKTNIIDVVKEIQTMYENELPLKFSREHNKFEGCSSKQVEEILKQAKGNWVLNRLLGIIFPSQMEASLWLSRTNSFSFFYNDCIKWLEDNSDTESFLILCYI